MVPRQARSVLLLVLVVAHAAQAGQNVVVVLDDSGSMAERMHGDRRTRKMEAAKAALTEVLEQLPPEAKVGVVALNRGAGERAWIVPLGTIDPPEVREAIQRISAQGGTPLGRYMKVAADSLLALRSQEHYGSYRLLIVTDGEATDRDLVERYLPDILSRGITVDVIGVDMEDDHSLATLVHTYRRADDPQSLARAIHEVFAESSGVSQDTGESDFELLAALPDQLAEAALSALTQSGNHAIGEMPEAGPPPVYRQGSVPMTIPDRPGSRAPTVVRLITGCFCVFIGLMAFAVIGIVLLVRKSR
jgi:uncharacterized protein YegL